ncbi:MAG: 50S ribosomal protein L6 [Candidatus Wallbacteria bacterium]|nr:50S ribosomal protein L6 [Candidatus Wallbacteria bacterium]MBI4867795.1 50S ribosomal protein L6 [Candidatus Wallbacteria bacterium]
MSRIGKLPVSVPDKVAVTVDKGLVTVKGPKGTLSQGLRPGVEVSVKDGKVHVTRADDKPATRALHGLTRALINNMCTGVSKEFERQLDLVGVGYRAKAEAKKLVLSVGFSNPVDVAVPEGIKVEVTQKGDAITLRGADKQSIGEFAAQLRRIRPPEPYKGKGIRYHEEQVKTKVGKKVGA